jgi:hypothetical protein
MLLHSFDFLFFRGFVSAFGTTKNSPEFRGCFSFGFLDLLHRDRLGQIARLVDVAASHHGDVVG